MVLIKLRYNPRKKHKWELIPDGFKEETYNGHQVVEIHEKLWGKIKNIIYLRSKGYDSLLLIDGKRRTGKSTLAKAIAYLLDPKITIQNYVAGLEESAEKIDEAKDESVLIFDEGSLVANSKDAMKKKNVQLQKVIDVVGQKKLTLIFCMPTFFDISKSIALIHSLFLIHVYTDDRLTRGRFAYFSTKKKKALYVIGKKSFGSYAKPKADWNGRFTDFHLPFEEEYMILKRQSLKEALGVEPKAPTREQVLKKYMVEFVERNPDMTKTDIAKVFGISRPTLYNSLEEHRKKLAATQEK